jgi:hypothetical protein
MLGCEGNFFKLVREGFKVSKKGEKAISKKKRILWKIVQTTRLKEQHCDLRSRWPRNVKTMSPYYKLRSCSSEDFAMLSLHFSAFI